jgi:hypothetical protein
MRKPNHLREVAMEDAPDLDAEIAALMARVAGLEKILADELPEMLVLEKTVVPEPPGARGPTVDQSANELLIDIMAVTAPVEPGPQRLWELQRRRREVLPLAIKRLHVRLAMLTAERIVRDITARGDEIRAAVRRRCVAFVEMRKANAAWIQLVEDLGKRDGVGHVSMLLPCSYTVGEVFDAGHDDDEIHKFLAEAIRFGIITRSEAR